MIQLLKPSRILGNILLFHLVFGHLVEVSRTFPDSKIHQFLQEAVNSKSNASLDGLSRCFLHFIEYDVPIFDYSSVTRPYIINKDYPPKKENETLKVPQTTSLYERKFYRPITKLPKYRNTFCVINVFLLSSSLFKLISMQKNTFDFADSLGIDRLPRQSSDTLYQISFESFARGRSFEIPELVKLNLFVVDWTSNSNSREDGQIFKVVYSKSTIKNPVLGADEAKEVSSYTKAPTFLLVSFGSTIKGGLYYCPFCFEPTIGGFGFSCEEGQGQSQGQDQNQNFDDSLRNSTDAKATSESCYSKMLRLYEKAVFFRKLSVSVDFSSGFLRNEEPTLQKVAQDQIDISTGQFLTPFDRNQDSFWKPPVRLDYATTFFVLSAINLTVKTPGGADRFDNFAREDPVASGFESVGESLMKIKETLFHSGSLFIVGENRFRLITADGVRKLKTGLEIYTAPFQWGVWISIFVSIATTTLAVMILLYFFNVGVRGRHEMKNLSLSDFGALCWDTFFWSSMILLEQGGDKFPRTSGALIESESESEPGQEIKDESTEKGWIQISRLTLGTWLLLSLVLTNGYTGVMKSEYADKYAVKKAVKYPFETEWQNIRDFLEKKFLFRTNPMDVKDFWTQYKNGGANFSVYYTSPNFPCESHTEFLRLNGFEWNGPDDSYNAPYMKFHTYFKARELGENCKDACSNTSLDFNHSNCTQIQDCVDYARNLILFHNTWLTCPQKLPSDIAKMSRDQRRSKGAAVSVVILPDRDFPRIWDIFKRMRRYSDISAFSNNKKVRDDDSFKDNEMYAVKSGVDRHYPTVMEKRMQQLLSSGIYWLWEKWDHRRFTDWNWNGGKTLWSVEENVEPFIPLSFRDSDIGLPFLIWSLCWLLALAVLTVEISWTWISKWKWRKIVAELLRILRFIRFLPATCTALIHSKFRKWAFSESKRVQNLFGKLTSSVKPSG